MGVQPLQASIGQRRAVDLATQAFQPGAVVGLNRGGGVQREAALIELDAESYKRPPADLDREHPLIKDLMRKDFIAGTDLSEREVCAVDFPQDFAARCKSASAFMEFLTEAVGHPF